MRVLRGLVAIFVLGTLVGCNLAPRRLTTTLGDTDTVITANLDDATGRIQGIEFVWPVPEWAFTPDLGEFAMRNDSPNVVWLTWTGGICPTSVSIEVTAEGDTTRLTFDPGKRCQSDVGRARVLAIHFAA